MIFFATPLKNMQTHVGLDHESPTFYPGENNKLMVEPTQLKNMLVKLDHFPQIGVKNEKNIFETTTSNGKLVVWDSKGYSSVTIPFIRGPFH